MSAELSKPSDSARKAPDAEELSAPAPAKPTAAPAGASVQPRIEAVARPGAASALGRVAFLGSAALLVVALVAAAWFGAGWLRAALTDGPRADARDTALDAARQAALNMTSMNLNDVPGSLALARSSMTGALLDSATKNSDQAEKLARQSGVAMTSKVLGAALTSLNSEQDKASALVVLQVTEKARDKAPAEYRYTWTVDVARDGAGWKADQVSSLGQPVLLSGGPSRQPPAPEQVVAPKPGS
ncbi:hypothetical protein [Nocardia sp. R6R-6]|uniref:hypothetical protein n=1 Tax=Nocardia sp. R6R-6 TaxID=3459303 RepID=UPI00403D6E0F